MATTSPRPDVRGCYPCGTDMMMPRTTSSSNISPPVSALSRSGRCVAGGRPPDRGMAKRPNWSHRIQECGKDRWLAGYTSAGQLSSCRTRPMVMAESATASRLPERTAAAYDEHRDLLHFLAAKRFRIPADEVDEIVHDVFVAFMRNETKISPLDERSWLVGATCNSCRYYWRKHQYAGSPEDLDQLIDPHLIADEAVIRLTVARLLRQIRRRCRDLLRRRYGEG